MTAQGVQFRLQLQRLSVQILQIHSLFFILIHHSMNPVTWGDFKERHDCELLYKNKEKS